MSPNLASFLNLGYFLDYKGKDLYTIPHEAGSKAYNLGNDKELIETGSRLIMEAVSSQFEPNRMHIVPLSGGLDSRAVLSGLLKFTEAKNIHTITFGLPGTWDYEIGRKIAERLGVSNTAYNLQDYTYSMEELMDISRRVDQQTVLFHHWPVWKVDEISQGKLMWSGFLGDAISGDHQVPRPAQTIDEAKVNYLKRNRYVKSINDFADFDFSSLLNTDLVEKKILTLEEQLDLLNHQRKFIEPHILMKGYNYKTPFTYKPLIDFLLNLNLEQRKNQNLYRRILLSTFPKAFSYSTKTTAGLPLSTPREIVFLAKGVNKVVSKVTKKSKATNFLNFNDKIREKEDLREIITSNIEDLQRRKIIPVNMLKLLKNHLDKKANHYDVLLVLCSLEMHLKTGKKLNI